VAQQCKYKAIDLLIVTAKGRTTMSKPGATNGCQNSHRQFKWCYAGKGLKRQTGGKVGKDILKHRAAKGGIQHATANLEKNQEIIGGKCGPCPVKPEMT